ncbi:hypothetical protein IAG25_27585 [Caballeronia sp. EK]|uniref:RIO1 family regulatory kinase/ATPase domain-containing protein n=1 Tax=Caballeronia sp. EK TaxID=2767469 RepID=UPI001655C97B|nr:RIO1 family regulatory kinase/ATPase [Caballeronia sp. EK]MBC8640602.1 hypothetical protein [Caballeronia sp. EK]
MKMPKRLAPLLEEGFIDEVIGQLMSGKEATVYVVRCGESTRCAKIYKDAKQRSFRQAASFCAGIIHGDLSEYNILLAADGPVIIDLPQAVDAAGNNEAASMLKRDVDNLAAYFGRFAPQILTASYGTEIWALFEAGRLHVEAELTGRIEADTRPVDLDGVLQELEATRLEDDARVRRQEELSAGR